MKKFFAILITGLAILLLGTAEAETNNGTFNPEILSMAAAGAIDTTGLQAYYGRFENKLISQMLNGLDIAKDIRVIRNLRSPLHLPKVTIDGGMRAMNLNVEKAKGGRNFTSRTITPKEIMKIMSVKPDEYRVLFLSDMLAPGAKREPFAQYLWNLEFQKLQDEINENCYFSVFKSDSAAFNPATAYAAGIYVKFEDTIWKSKAITEAGQSPTTHAALWDDVDASTTVDGLGTIIAQAVTNDELPADNIVNTGAITSSTAVAQFEAMYKSLPAKLRGKIKTLYCSYNSLDLYNENFKAAYPYSSVVNNQNGNSDLYLYGTNGTVQIKPVTWMNDSSRLILTPKENLVMGTDLVTQTTEPAKVIEKHHGYDTVVKFIQAYQVPDTEVLFINDQI